MIVIDKYKKYLLKGLMYYTNSILFVRPFERILMKFVKRVLMRRSYEFNSHSLFAVYNRDVGVLIVDASRYYDYAWRYRGRKR
jgi:hypothetical protein